MSRRSVFPTSFGQSGNLFTLSQNPWKAAYDLERNMARTFGHSTSSPGQRATLVSHLAPLGIRVYNQLGILD